MNRIHGQDKEWALVQSIRKLRQAGSAGAELGAMEQELLAAFRADIADVAAKVRAKYRNYRLYQQDNPERDGILENRLKFWLLHYAVAAYDPKKNDSFKMYVLNGWWSHACLQPYLEEFKPPTTPELDQEGQPKKDANGKRIEKPVRVGSLESAAWSGSGEARPLAHMVSEGRQVKGGGLARESSHDAFEMRHDLEVMVDGSGLPRKEVLAVLGPLLLPACKPEKSNRRRYREKCSCPGCTSDEHRRREAMLVLLRSDLSCPDCSDEFQCRKWWNDLVAEPE